MMRRTRFATTRVILGALCMLITACSNNETYTDNPTVDAVKIAEQARWAQTFGGGIVVYVKTAGGSDYSPDTEVCIARLSGGTQPHTVIDPETERCHSVDGAR